MQTIVMLMVIGLPPAIASPVPPPVLPDELHGEATLKFRPATRLSLGSTSVEFEKTTLHELVAAAKVGSIEHQGDGGASISWVCFTNLRARPGERIWLISNVMGGPERAIVEVIAEQLPAGAASSEGCPQLPARMTPARLDRGVWLGLPESLVARKFGKPSETRGEWQTFYHAGKLPGRYKAPGDPNTQVVTFDVTNVLETQIREGAVRALRATHVTSY